MSSSVAVFSGRYAGALFELADEANSVDAVARDLAGLSALIDESEDLERMVRSPGIDRKDQAKAMDAVLEKSGADMLVRKFVGAVALNGRLFALKEIISQFLEDLAARRGEVSAEVVSAITLDAPLEEELHSAVSRVAGSDRVSMDVRTDPSLIGGLVVRIGSRMIDSSIRTKLNRLELNMKGTG